MRGSWMLLLWVLALAACGAPPAAPATVELNVFAAASLRESFTVIGRNFDAANPGVKVIFNFAGSQQLAGQIGQGAPADVFASANQTQLNTVIGSGQVLRGSERVFVRNRLVVIAPRANPAQLGALPDLARPGLKLVLAARAVPAGSYTLDMLAKATQLPAYTTSFSATVLRNVVSYEDNVRSVLSKVALGEADAGVVYSSDVSEDLANEVLVIPIPDEVNVVASYPIAPIKDAANAALAAQFVQHVLAPESQQILARYGFIPAVPTGT
jgi:molybdate transport system substrate-binding protein